MQFCLQLLGMGLLCCLAGVLWMIFPPAAVPVLLLIVGICNSDQ